MEFFSVFRVNEMRELLHIAGVTGIKFEISGSLGLNGSVCSLFLIFLWFFYLKNEFLHQIKGPEIEPVSH